MKKILGVILVVGLLLASLAAPQRAFAQAASNPPCPAGSAAANCNATVGGATFTPTDIINAVNSPTPNLANTTAYVFYTISVLINGTFDPNNSAAISYGGSSPVAQYPTNVQEALNNRGALGGVGYMMAELIKNKPASAGTYVAYIRDNSHFAAGPAYAQGIGFSALSPILGTWIAFRDMAYYLLTVMFLVTGFLILIRHKVSGNVAVTVQNALPRLVLTLIVITFSYPIAGLVVDLMFLCISFIVNLFTTKIFQGPEINAILGTPAHLAYDTHIFEFTLKYIFGSPGVATSGAWQASQALGTMVYSAVSNAAGLQGAFSTGGFFGSLFSGILTLIFAIIFGIALLIAMFRVFFALLMSYVGFIMNVVMSPLILLQGAIPGKDPFKDWLKNLLAGLAPFVVAIFMIFMSLALTGIGTRPGIGYNHDNPSQAGLRLPLILSGNIPADSFIGILGMGFMLLMPEAVNIAKKMIGAKGGIMDEYKDKAINNFKSGWKGAGPISGKGLVQGTGRAAIGGVIGGVGGAIAARNSAQNQGKGTLATIGSTLSGGAAGAAGGAVILGPGIPAYNAGMKILKKEQQYSGTINSATLAIQEQLRDRAAKKGVETKGQNIPGAPQPGGAIPTAGQAGTGAGTQFGG